MATLQEKIIAVLKNPNAQYNDFSKVIDEGLASGEITRQNNQSSFQLEQGIFSQYKKDAGLKDSNLKLWKDTQYRKWRTARDAQDYGTFIAPQTGKQVVMHTPEDLKNALVLGFKKVKEGSTQPTPEEISMIQAAGYKGKELQASLDAYNKANPKVQGVQQTYDPVTGKTTYGTTVEMASAGQAMTPDQEAAAAAKKTIESGTGTMGRKWGEALPGQGYPQVEGPGNPSWEARNPDKNPNKDISSTRENSLGKAGAAQQSGIDISKFSPVSGGVTDQVRGATTPTQNNLTMASAGQDPNITPTSTAPTTPQINFKSGLNDAQKQSITNLISKGSVLNENDAKNVAYALGINDYSQFVGKTGQEAIGSSAGQPTRDTMQANVMQVAQTQPMQKATTDFITQAFESIHGRPPEPDEIARYQNKTTADALTEIQGGAPQPKTQADLDLMNQGFERILNPQSLEDLKAAGLDPTKIVKVGNKLYKPGSFSVDSSSAAMPSEFTGAKGIIKTDGLGVGGNTKYTAGVTAAANDYYGQYLEQIAPQFYADRQAYWNSVLTSSDFREKTLLNLEDKYQLDELSKNLTDIDAKIAAKNTAYSTLLNDIENQPMSMARIIGEGNHVRKLQAVEINSLLAQREAIQGNYDRAEKMMTNMYNAKVADYTDNIAAMKDWYSEQKDFFTKQEQRSYDAKIKEEERNFEMYKDNLSAVRTLMSNYPTANISLNDDYTTAINKASKVPAKGDYAAIADPSGFGGIVIYDKSTGRPVTQISAFGGTTTSTSNTSNITGSAEQIAQAIKTVESGGNYNASGGSGEFGAYQFMPATWTAWSGEYAKANGINQSLSPTPENQDKVAQYKIQSWLNQGYTPTQIAATWNSGSPDGWETKKGVNSYGVAYDVPAYVQKVTSALASINPTQQQNTSLPPLPKNVQDAVFQEKAKFGSEKAVVDYQTAMENVSTLLRLDPENSTSTDNMQAVYAFAKIMDPGGTVKEGEFKTAEDYAQALFQKAGLAVKRVFDNSNYLTPEAVSNMQNTVLVRAGSIQNSYDNIYNQYGSSINRYVSSYMPGFSQGSQYLIDYATPYRQMPVVVNYNGQEYEMTFADYIKASQN